MSARSSMPRQHVKTSSGSPLGRLREVSSASLPLTPRSINHCELWTVNVWNDMVINNTEWSVVHIEFLQGHFFPSISSHDMSIWRSPGATLCVLPQNCLQTSGYYQFDIFFQRNMSSCRPHRCHKMRTYSPHRRQLMNARCIKLGITLSYIGTIILHKIVREKTGPCQWASERSRLRTERSPSVLHGIAQWEHEVPDATGTRARPLGIPPDQRGHSENIQTQKNQRMNIFCSHKKCKKI